MTIFDFFEESFGSEIAPIDRPFATAHILATAAPALVQVCQDRSGCRKCATVADQSVSTGERFMRMVLGSEAVSAEEVLRRLGGDGGVGALRFLAACGFCDDAAGGGFVSEV